MTSTSFLKFIVREMDAQQRKQVAKHFDIPGRSRMIKADIEMWLIVRIESSEIKATDLLEALD